MATRRGASRKNKCRTLSKYRGQRYQQRGGNRYSEKVEEIGKKVAKTTLRAVQIPINTLGYLERFGNKRGLPVGTYLDYLQDILSPQNVVRMTDPIVQACLSILGKNKYSSKAQQLEMMICQLKKEQSQMLQIR